MNPSHMHRARAASLRFVPLLAMLALGGCQNLHLPSWLSASAPASPSADATYTVGAPYQSGGVWYYPHEQFAYTATGLATQIARRPGRTADGEVYDPTALVASHPTLQLPAIARVTDLETGRSLLVRINDRGPGDPHGLIGLSPRAVALLGAGAAPFRVRVELQEAESRQLTGGQNEAAHLKIDTAPQAAIAAEDLAPPSGETASTRGHVLPPDAKVAPVLAATPVPTVPARLPEQVTQGQPAPGQLYVELARFSAPSFAMEMVARLPSLGAVASADYESSGEPPFRVRIGPLRDIATAEATLDRALREGVSDARIVVNDD